MKAVCQKCRHRKSCKAPCRPVELHLREDNPVVYEKSFVKDGQKVDIIFARSREVPETALTQKFTGEPASEALQVFSTENDSPFASFKPQLKQTGIFIDRFFYNASYQDLAVKYDISEHAAIKIYYAATKRLMEIIEALDGKQDLRNLDHWKKKVEDRSGSMPKGQRWFLLNKLFGFRPSEIAELEGLDKRNSSVRQLIIRVSDQLKAGEISLIDCTPEETKAAKVRLEARNAKRRERYARKKAHAI